MYLNKLLYAPCLPHQAAGYLVHVIRLLVLLNAPLLFDVQNQLGHIAQVFFLVFRSLKNLDNYGCYRKCNFL